MGQKYLPTIRDQKATQRYQEQQRRRAQATAPAAKPAKPAAATEGSAKKQSK